MNPRPVSSFSDQLGWAFVMTRIVITRVVVGVALCIGLASYRMMAILNPELGWPSLDHDLFRRACQVLLLGAFGLGIAGAINFGVRVQRNARRSRDAAPTETSTG